MKNLSPSLPVVLILGMNAQPLLAAGESTWKSSAELGIVNTTGNTETQTINAKAKTENERDKWRHSASIEALKTSDHGTVTAERYTVSGQTNYKYTKHSYSFVTATYEDARFTGYDYQINAAVGYGHRVTDTAVVKLDLEAGPGMRHTKLENGGTDEEGVLHAAAKLLWLISKTSEFTEDLVTDIGQDATITKSVSALKAQINGSLATKVTYTVKHTSEVPDGVKNTDTETAVTLVYSF